MSRTVLSNDAYGIIDALYELRSGNEYRKPVGVTLDFEGRQVVTCDDGSTWTWSPDHPNGWNWKERHHPIPGSQRAEELTKRET